MGVQSLWSVLSEGQGCCYDLELDKLAGKKLAVDLSVWIIQCQQMMKACKNAPKPHLLNIFNKAMGCAKANIRLVFCTEGTAPDLKQKARSGGLFKKVGVNPKFVKWTREAAEMLTALGFSVVNMHGGEGEAEAMCALLNKLGIVDGVITTDSDAFLFGAETVYKELSVDANRSSTRCYTLDAITANLGLGVNKMICMAMLLGADYTECGLKGVGEKQALRLMDSLSEEKALYIFRGWLCEEEVSPLPSYSVMSEADLADMMHSYGLKKRSRPGMIKALTKIWLGTNASTLHGEFPEVQTEELTFIAKIKMKFKARYTIAQFDAIVKAYKEPHLKVTDVYRLLGNAGAVCGLDVPIRMDVPKAQALMCSQVLWEQSLCLGKLHSVLFTTSLYWCVHLSPLPCTLAEYTGGWEPKQIVKRKTEHFKEKFVIEWKRREEMTVSVESCALVEAALPHLFLLFQQGETAKEQAKEALLAEKQAKKDAREEKAKVRAQQKAENSAKKARVASPAKAKSKSVAVTKNAALHCDNIDYISPPSSPLFPASSPPVFVPPISSSFLAPSSPVCPSSPDIIDCSLSPLNENSSSSNNVSFSMRKLRVSSPIRVSSSSAVSSKTLFHFSPSPLPQQQKGQDNFTSTAVASSFSSPSRLSAKKKLFRGYVCAELLSPDGLCSPLSSFNASSTLNTSVTSSVSGTASYAALSLPKERAIVQVECSDNEEEAKHDSQNNVTHESFDDEEEGGDGGFLRGNEGGGFLRDEEEEGKNVNIFGLCENEEQGEDIVYPTPRNRVGENFTRLSFANEKAFEKKINDQELEEDGDQTEEEDVSEKRRRNNKEKPKQPEHQESKRAVFEFSLTEEDESEEVKGKANKEKAVEEEEEGNLIVLSYSKSTREMLEKPFQEGSKKSAARTRRRDNEEARDRSLPSLSIDVLWDNSNSNHNFRSRAQIDNENKTSPNLFVNSNSFSPFSSLSLSLDLTASPISSSSSSSSFATTKTQVQHPRKNEARLSRKSSQEQPEQSKPTKNLSTSAVICTNLPPSSQQLTDGWMQGDNAPSALSPSAMSDSSPQLAVETIPCPICNKAYSLSTIERHANKCIEQQESKAEFEMISPRVQMANLLLPASPSQRIVSASSPRPGPPGGPRLSLCLPPPPPRYPPPAVILQEISLKKLMSRSVPQKNLATKDLCSAKTVVSPKTVKACSVEDYVESDIASKSVKENSPSPRFPSSGLARKAEGSGKRLKKKLSGKLAPDEADDCFQWNVVLAEMESDTSRRKFSFPDRLG